MSPEVQELSASDPCPACGGAFIVDGAQSAERLIEHHKRVAANPNAHALYAEKVREKIATDGVLYRCATCPYHARFAASAGDKPSKRRAAADRASQ